MDIETLQKLKDAGFPQQGDGRTIVRPSGTYYVPTLSELFEEIGDVQITIFPMFYRSRLIGADSMVEKWVACVVLAWGEGKTRDEALANLYIYSKNQ